MSEQLTKAERDRQRLIEAQQRGILGRVGTYFRLSGPGWIASAITLGGGSLASSLFLGIYAGYSLMWLQPFAMVMGIIMLSAIGYVTLSTGEKPFPAINEHVNPVLGWSWALAVAAANMIWCMPQFSLANGVLTQNLIPGVLGEDQIFMEWTAGILGFVGEGDVSNMAALKEFVASRTADTPLVDLWRAWLGLNSHKVLISVVILLLCTIVTWSYDSGGWGLRIYETILKLVVAMIVLCFVGVVIQLTRAGQLEWDVIAAGLIPDFTQFWKPAGSFLPVLDAIGEPGNPARDFWENKVVSGQRDVMISAAATAVGINMTFMFPYTMLRKGWTKEFRGLSIFDLSTGMFIPYVLATGCVVIAAASQFHTEVAEGFAIEVNENNQVVSFAEPDLSLERPLADQNRVEAAHKKYQGLIKERQKDVKGEITLAEKRAAATLIKRDAMDLAASLKPLTGSFVANIVFGLGVLGMVISTISILMLISGFVFAEMLGCRPGGWVHKAGTMVAGMSGALWMFVWTGGQSQFYLAVVTSVFGFMLMPFAYVTFVLVMNSKSLLGDERPRGIRRVIWNVLMFIAAAAASIGALYMIWIKSSDAEAKGVTGAPYIAYGTVIAFVMLAVMVAINRYNTARQKKVSTDGDDRDS
jgi:Mn2+/Fe2+ NRAMP family transporter